MCNWEGISLGAEVSQVLGLGNSFVIQKANEGFFTSKLKSA